MAVSELTGTAVGTAPVGSMARVDFRRPSGFTREGVRSLAAVHELFTRRVVTGWGTQLRAVVQLEEISVEQASYDEYITTMPSPSALTLIDIAPLPAPVIVELNTQLALTLVDRLLGGRGTAQLGSVRRLTDVETALLEHLLQHVVDGLGEALGHVATDAPTLRGVEYNPQLVQVASPSDRVVLLTYRVTLTQGISSEGLLTICYPAAVAGPLLEALTGHSDREDLTDDEQAGAHPGLVEHLHDVPVDVRIGLTPTPVAASDLRELEVGDVLRIAHRVDQTVEVQVGDAVVARGHLGRRGRRLAVQLATDLYAESSEGAAKHLRR